VALVWGCLVLLFLGGGGFFFFGVGFLGFFFWLVVLGFVPSFPLPSSGRYFPFGGTGVVEVTFLLLSLDRMTLLGTGPVFARFASCVRVFV